MSVVRHRTVSMFSGCGGMDLGFLGGFVAGGTKYRRNPVDIVWANDVSPAACRSYEYNLAHEIKKGDVWSLLETLPGSADVLIGGFPCQDISVNGKGAGVAGKRSGLYRAMISAIDKTRPRIFVAENVKGLLMRHNRESLDQVIRAFEDLGYEVSYSLYQAASYGVPQTRERVLIVGTDRDTKPFEPPVPTHDESEWISVADAIRDLEDSAEDTSINHIWSRAKRSPEQGDRRLKPDRPGQTIRAECHGNIQWHYRLDRRISMREAARIQSFPDSFLFSGGIREIERQIGNAVPPVLAWHIAKSVIRSLAT
jgi:DNA (cytosine-5)-methyltransferase 1